MRKVLLCVVASSLCACAPAPVTTVSEDALQFGSGALAAEHVLLLSVDGLHAVDLERFVAAHPQSAMAQLAAHGLTYANASTSRPSDSFPGLLALVTGGSPASTGVYYDDSYDRSLSPPGSNCSTTGAEIVYDESIDVDPNAVDGGGGIDPANLPLDPARGCKPVWPHQFLRVNTVFEVAHHAGLRTAWSDKHPAYDIVKGPSGRGVDDLYTPEVNAVPGDVGSIEAYDDRKVAAIVDEIHGWTHDRSARVGVPALFGMNFQAVSVAQKAQGGGYLDGAATPSRMVADALAQTDASLQTLLDALTKNGLLHRTLVVLTAKHGQSPIDPAARKIVDKKLLAQAVSAAQITADDVAYLWLPPGAQAETAAAGLEAQRDALSIDRIYFGDDLDLLFGPGDVRRPDLVVQPRAGVIYAKPSATKIAEHGGLAEDDVHVAMIVSKPGVPQRLVRTPVATTQVAPTMLQVLGLNPSALDAVRAEDTQPLPLK